MNLYAFDSEKVGERFRAFTRDKAGKSLKNAIFISHANIRIQPHEWEYAGVVSTTGLANEHIKRMHAKIRRDGFVVVSMPQIVRHFYVFDLQLDIADLRIYSADRKLSQFNSSRYQMELRPRGSYLKGGEPEYVGELHIQDEKSANALGLDYMQLQDIGFEVIVVRYVSSEETLQRSLQRDFPKLFPKFEAKFGIEITDFNFRVKKSVGNTQDTRSAKENLDMVSPKPHTYNIKILDKKPEESTESGNSFFDWWLFKLLGVLAAILTLVLFFIG